MAVREGEDGIGTGLGWSVARMCVRSLRRMIVSNCGGSRWCSSDDEESRCVISNEQTRLFADVESMCRPSSIVSPGSATAMI